MVSHMPAVHSNGGCFPCYRSTNFVTKKISFTALYWINFLWTCYQPCAFPCIGAFYWYWYKGIRSVTTSKVPNKSRKNVLLNASAPKMDTGLVTKFFICGKATDIHAIDIKSCTHAKFLYHYSPLIKRHI